MAIDPTKPVDRHIAAKGIKGKKKTSSTSFADNIQTDETAVELQEVNSVASINIMQVVEAVGGDVLKKDQDQQLKYADDLMEHLNQLRLDILSGHMNQESLFHLADKLKNNKKAKNLDQLNKILDAIELRAEVELAKLKKIKPEKP